MGKKSVSFSPLSFLKGLSTASRKFVTAVPLTEYLNSGSEAKRPTRIVLFSTLITPRIKPPRMGTLTMRTLRASPEQSNLARPVLCHRRRHPSLHLRLGKHRHLPSAIPLNSQPQDGPPDGLCGLSLVVSHNLLVAQVLHPLALLAANLGGVLPGWLAPQPASAAGHGSPPPHAWPRGTGLVGSASTSRVGTPAAPAA